MIPLSFEFVVLGLVGLMVFLFFWLYFICTEAIAARDRYIELLERVINEIDPASVHGDLYGTIEEALGL